MARRILVLGGTGLLGRPAVRCLIDNGHTVRLLTRSRERTTQEFGDSVEIVEGSATSAEDVARALKGMDAAHINLTPAIEYRAMEHVVEQGQGQLERISYVSATTLSEENRWFYRVDIKLRTEALLQGSGIPNVIYRPTWVMETLPNFVNGRWATVVVGKRPPPLHFFAAMDFGRMVAASYEDDRGLGKCLYVYGPEAIPLADALKRFVDICHPQAFFIRLGLWQARLLAKLIRNPSLAEVTELVAYLDVAGEVGDGTEANELYGAPATTLEAWSRMPHEEGGGWPH